MPAYADRQRNARLARNARADAKRAEIVFADVSDDESDCGDVPDCDGEPSLRADADVISLKFDVAPEYPPSRQVKDYLDAAWAFEDARRRAAAVKAASKNRLSKVLPREIVEPILDQVCSSIEADLSARSTLVEAALDAARFRTRLACPGCRNVLRVRKGTTFHGDTFHVCVHCGTVIDHDPV